MHFPDTPSLFFLFYLLLLLPWMALKSSRKLRGSPRSAVAFSDSQLERIWISTILHLSIMFALAWTVGNGFEFQVFAIPVLTLRIGMAAVAALSFCLLIRIVARRFRKVDERKQMLVFALAARTCRQWCLKLITIVAASLGEEAAYRGVGWEILTYAIGDPRLAAFICSAAFAMAHWMQGWKSMSMIFLIAAIMHVLVWYTKSLVPAMIVHGVYDVIAISLIAAEASRQRQSMIAGNSEETVDG